MSFDVSEQALIRAIIERADKHAALDVLSGVLHPGTALAVFGILRDVVRPLDPQLAETLVPRATEDAASNIAATAATEQMKKETL
ncbi:MAG TPA: hypothetical protein VGM54_10120 [Chthoniobacter sp.]|jgi:hypothetical protein